MDGRWGGRASPHLAHDEAARKSATGKRDRSAFGYMEPHPQIKKFAQCGACIEWLRNPQRCYLLQPDDEVLPGDSCIMYAQGEPQEDGTPSGALTKKEVGFYRGKVRCQNCISFAEQDDGCDLYTKLDEQMPDLFALGRKVKPLACCNAFDGD